MPYFQVKTCKQIRTKKETIFRDSLMAVEKLKSKLQEEYNENKEGTNTLSGYEAKLIALKSKTNKIDPMDHKSLKSIYDEAVHIMKSLNNEFSSVSN